MRILTLTAAAMLAISGVAQADLIIDDFTQPPGFQQAQVTGGAGTDTSLDNDGGGAESEANIINGYRDISVTVTSTIGPNGTSGAQIAVPGLLSISNDSSTISVTTVTWDGLAGAGLEDNAIIGFDNGVGYDITQGAADISQLGIILDLLAIDIDFELTVKLTDSAGEMAQLSKTFNPAVPQVVFKPLLDFLGNNGSISLTNITTIELIAVANGPADLEINFIKVGVVPEPASMAIMGLGGLLAGCGVARRRRKQASELVS